MKHTLILLALGLFSFFILTGASIAADITNPILKKLVEKGILTKDEATEVMDELKQEAIKEEQLEKKVEETAKDVEGVKKDSEKTLGIFKGLSIGVKSYFEYRNGNGSEFAGSGIDRNTFRLTRAYLDVKKQLTDNLLVRWTSDYQTKTPVNSDGTTNSGAKDTANVFMKYLYLDYKLPLPVESIESSVTAGIVPAPYIAFYEDIWPYRMRDTIPQERFSVLDASADLGVTVSGKFKIAGADIGSYAAGLFNDQHYRLNDNNLNKAIEGRISIRPLATTGIEFLKGLELTYFGIRGKDGNQGDAGTSKYGDDKNDTFLADYSYAGLTLGYEYYKTTRFGGTATESNFAVYNESIDGKSAGTKHTFIYDNATGQTLFAVYRLPSILPSVLRRVRVFGEYAMLDKIIVDKATNPKNGKITSSVYGLSYDIYKDKTVLLLDYDNVKYDNIGTAADDNIYQAVIQIAY